MNLNTIYKLLEKFHLTGKQEKIKRTTLTKDKKLTNGNRMKTLLELKMQT